MGQAKHKGTFEERKAKAIEEGRVKSDISSKEIEREIMRDLSRNHVPNFLSILLGAKPGIRR